MHWFNKCIKNPNILKKLKKDSSDASFMGGSGTPFLLIDGSPYKGNWLHSKNLEKHILKIINNKWFNWIEIGKK